MGADISIYTDNHMLPTLTSVGVRQCMLSQ